MARNYKRSWGWGGMMAFTLSDRRRGARMYAPDEGRWKGMDALGEKYVRFSPYVYVANNPLLFVDPNGNDIFIVIDGQSQRVTQEVLDNPDNNSSVVESLRIALRIEDNYIGKYLDSKEHDVYISTSQTLTKTLTNANEFNAGEEESFKLDSKVPEKFGELETQGLDSFNGLDVSSSNEEGKTYSLVLLNSDVYGETATEESIKGNMALFAGGTEEFEKVKYQGAYELNHEAGAHIDNRNDPKYPGNPHAPAKGANPNNQWDYWGQKEVILRARVKDLYEKDKN
ncbi:MAG: RHS repeat-associated core domain-containing protein [Bacteroidia bacterium]